MNLESVKKEFGDIQIVDNFNFEIDPISLPKILINDPVSKCLKLSHGDIIFVDGQYMYVF